MEFVKMEIYVYLLCLFLCSFFNGSHATCGGDITAGSGEIKSPDYPLGYPVNQDCTWNIRAPASRQIVLKMQFIDINEGGETCLDDYVMYQQVGDINPKAYCGKTIPSDVITKTNEVKIRFKSGSKVRTNTGFSLSYSLLELTTTTVQTTTTIQTTTTMNVSTTTATTNSTVAPTKDDDKRLSGGSITAICIVVLLVLILIIDLILYQYHMGVIYTIKEHSCGGYNSMDQQKC